MLSVGREINIRTRRLLCSKCTWQGAGAELETGLIRISDGDIYLYAYRCPGCGSFDVTAKGKLLTFRARTTSIAHENSGLNADYVAEHPRAAERTNRSWK